MQLCTQQIGDLLVSVAAVELDDIDLFWLQMEKSCRYCTNAEGDEKAFTRV